MNIQKCRRARGPYIGATARPTEKKGLPSLIQAFGQSGVLHTFCPHGSVFVGPSKWSILVFACAFIRCLENLAGPPAVG